MYWSGHKVGRLLSLVPSKRSENWSRERPGNEGCAYVSYSAGSAAEVTSTCKPTSMHEMSEASDAQNWWLKDIDDRLVGCKSVKCMQIVWHWITHGSSPGEVLDSTCTMAEATQLFCQNQASQMRANIPKCFPINQPAIKKIQHSLVLWARLACAPCMTASPARLYRLVGLPR